MSEWWTTEQVADALGVRVKSVYAYVSRGMLHSHRGPDGRSSRFDADEVHALLARRRRAEFRPAPRGMRSAITLPRADGLYYRGVSLTDLLGRYSFEQVAELLWTGNLGRADPWGPMDLPRRSGDFRTRLLDALITAEPPAGSTASQGRWLIRRMLAALAPATGRTVAERLWPALTDLPATPPRIAVLDAALIAMADHELAGSTTAVRLAVSLRAELPQAMLAGMSVLWTPLHGLSPARFRRLLPVAAEQGVPAAVAQFPSFQHPLYPQGDPRARLLAPLIVDGRFPTEPTRLVTDLLAAVPMPTVDLALAALGHCMDARPAAETVLWAIGRSAGWVAHAIEEYAAPPGRLRPRAEYDGTPPEPL
ncbi:helix-turn-helix domain-containing protein [Pseudonocardiaceae bacterium YIM PH 21723]|nr:helix-turn-helix domain-containing protein [Pseudonocardiaceae bacterium YIM PH 21723]